MSKKLNSNLLPRFMLYVFSIMVITLLTILAIILLVFHLGFVPYSLPKGLFPIGLLLVISTVISTFFTFFIGRRIFSPIEALIGATKKVAKGNFQIHLDENYHEKKIRDMNIHFNKMIRELSGIETLRNDFIVNVSHEFKTPISTIEGYATLLQDPNLSEDERKEYTQMILDSTRSLSSLSENILRISKFETQQILPEKAYFSLDEQLRQALLSLEAKWSKKSLDIDMELPSFSYYGNEEFLMQVWLNIFGNAIKFTPKNGKISTSLREYNNGILVSVSDTGIGMSEEIQGRIFEKFYQADKNRNSEGNGLGLTLVKRIIDLFEGTIEVKSAPMKGTTFNVWLPVNVR